MQRRIVVIEENQSKRNIKFVDQISKKEFSRVQIVKKIECGDYPDYHIRKINGVKTPASNPDKKESNNLG